MRLFRRLQLLSLALALGAATPWASVRAAELQVSDLIVSYSSQTETNAAGSVSFTLRLESLGDDPGNYDLFSAQVQIQKLLEGGVPAVFTLDEVETENTAPLAPDYWIDAVPTGHQNASTQGGQFRFSDFVSMPQAITPDVGDIVARFVIDFTVLGPDGFGDYDVIAGLQQYNKFSADLVNHFNNTITPGTFTLAPIPEPATLALAAFGLVLVRRRRRA